MHLRRRIELYLRRTRTAPTRFGRDAVNDPRFVLDLRNARSGRKTAAESRPGWTARGEEVTECGEGSRGALCAGFPALATVEGLERLIWQASHPGEGPHIVLDLKSKSPPQTRHFLTV